MINIEASLNLIQRMAKEVRKELSGKTTVEHLHDKIIFLLMHRHDGVFEGKTFLAKALCILDALVLGKRDHIVIDYFGPEDANFPRAISLLSARKLLYVQQINSREHVLLTWRGYDYFRKVMGVRIHSLVEFVRELTDLAHKTDENLVNTAYHILFNVRWGERRVPLESFLREDEVIYNSFAYNFYKYQPVAKRRRNVGLYEKEKIRADVDDLVLPSLVRKGLDGDDMKDGQRLALPYLEAANFFIMATGRQPTLKDIANIAFSRLSYYEKMAKNEYVDENERKKYENMKEAIMDVCNTHLEILCGRGLLREEKEGKESVYIPTARTYSFGDYTYTLLSRNKVHSYLSRMEEYIETYRRALNGIMIREDAHFDFVL